ncbi:MAG: LPS assembly lipoprotein LptE [Candidatus Omnitrophica bacterium]|nr:LPS assembly lipoprotein LptE [Candidatus Omnitrophota bacterium]MDD5253010.1 LptE family protein [Candidatus Omnitrophota bacterium]
MKNKLENYGLHSFRQSHKVNFFLFLFAICCLLVTAFSGCGYTTRSMLYGKYSTIYITPFLNKVDVIQESYSANKYRIYRPMLETDITKKVINRYLFDGNLKPVKEDQADLVLKGELIEYRKDPLSYTSDSEDVTEYRINIYVNLKLWDKKENKIMWEENNFNGNYSYFVKNSTINPGNNVVVVSEGAAVNSAVEDLARRIVERTVEQW